MQRGSTSPLSRETDAPETIVKLECDIDDASPEVLAYAADRLREAGAREVHWLPLYCKKGRPGWQLQVICAREDIDRLQMIIFLETTALNLDEDTAWSNWRYESLRITFTFTHTHLGWLLCDWLVREDADPNLSLALHVAGNCHTGGLNLTSCNPFRFQ